MEWQMVTQGLRKLGGRWLWVMGVAAVTVGATGIVLATPGSGAQGTILGRAVFKETVDIKIKLRDEREVIQAPGAGETVIQRIVLAAGGHTGWHSHPGPAIALVVRGELTLYSGEDPSCTPHTYSAGQAFVDSGQGHVHLARNLLNSETEVLVTYLDVPVGGGVRVDVADPGVCVF